MAEVLIIIVIVIFGLAWLTVIFGSVMVLLQAAALPIIALFKAVCAIGKFIQDLFDQKF